MPIINVRLNLGEGGVGIQTSFQMIAENNSTGQVTIAMNSEGVWPENWNISEEHAKAAFQSLFSNSGIPVTFAQPDVIPEISIIPTEVWTAAGDDVPKHSYWQLATNLENTGAWHWARYPAGTAEAEIKSTGSGGWLLGPEKSGEVGVVGNNETLDIPVGGEDGNDYVLALYQHVDGVDSNVVLQTYTAYIVDNAAPYLETASVSSTNSLILSFSKPVMHAIMLRQWQVTIGEDDHQVITDVTHVAGQSNVTISIEDTIASGEAVTVSYTPGYVTDVAGNRLEPFSTTAVNSLGLAEVTFISGAVSGDTDSTETDSARTEELNIDMTNHRSTDKVLVMVGTLNNGPGDKNYQSAKLNGVPASGIYTVHNDTGVEGPLHWPMTGYFIFPPGDYPENSELEIKTDHFSWDSGVAVYGVSSTADILVLREQPITNRSGSVLNENIPLNGPNVSIVACQMVANGSRVTNIDGAIQDYEKDARSREFFVSASEKNVAGGAPYALSFSSAQSYTSALAVKVEATS